MDHGEGEAQNRSPVSVFRVFGSWRRRIGMDAISVLQWSQRTRPDTSDPLRKSVGDPMSGDLL
jgi:hypothetical protein